MTAWTNHVAIAADRNGTNTHTVDPSTGTVVAGEVFTPTAGRLLICVAAGSATSTTPIGWKLPDGGSAENFTGLYVWVRTATGGDSFETEHNGIDFPVMFHFLEFEAGSTFARSAAQAGVENGGTGPVLTGLFSQGLLVFGIASQANGTVERHISWDIGTELVDYSEPTTTTEGYNFSVTFTESPGETATFAATSEHPLPMERLAFAVAPPFEHPVPGGAAHDYTAIAPEDVGVGDHLFAVKEIHGEVTAADLSDGMWSFALDVTRIDGATETDVAVFPEVPSTMGDDWWVRYRINRRQPKPAEGDLYEAPDGSKWIYSGDGTGKLTRYLPSFSMSFLGEITTDPRDLYIDPDTEHDWIPVHNGGDIEVGDVISYGQVLINEVDDVTVTDHGTYFRTEFLSGGEVFAWSDSAPAPVVPGVRWTFLTGAPGVPADTKFEAPDGSKWIYTGAAFFCWKSGAVYQASSEFQRVDTDLLTEI